VKYLKIHITLLFLLGASWFYGQELPPVNIYSPKDYGAENQNWAISQSKDKLIYVANNIGLLEFNGEKWELYPSPNGTIFRSVKVFKDKIFTGFYMNFGFWSKDNFGVLNYTSLSDTSKIPLLEDEQFWNIIELDGWMLFQSLQRIYLYHIERKEIRIINSESTILKMMEIEGVIYFYKQGKGLYKIENGNAILVSDHTIFKTNLIVNVFKEGNQLLVLTQDNGFYLLEGNNAQKWNIKANSFLSQKSIYSSIKLSNGDFAIGTISDGFFYLKKDGTIDYQINQSFGLSNNTILSIFEDQNQNIWLGLDSGINNINTSSPFKIFNDPKGTIGTIYTSKVHGGYLYIGTNQGLFYKRIDTDLPFQFIENTQGQVWNLTILDNQLFCGHNTGTFLIENKKATQIVELDGAWDFKKISDNLILQGNYNGLHILEKKNKTWSYRNKLSGFDNSSKHFEKIGNTVFVNHEYKGVFKLMSDPKWSKIYEVKKDTTISKGIHSSLIQYQDHILYANEDGVYKYDLTSNSFKRDSLFSTLYSKANYDTGKLVANDDVLWGFSKKHLSYISPDALSDNLKVHQIPLTNNLREGASGYENISTIGGKKYIIGKTNGYILLDMNKIKPPHEFKVSIDLIKNSSPSSNTKKHIEKVAVAKFENHENVLEFDFSVPNYAKFAKTKYQYYLEGSEGQWSDWSYDASASFKNLPSGTYTFKVKAKVGNNVSINTATYTFEIAKKWYVSNSMIVVYIIGLILFSFFMHMNYKRYYKKQQIKLLNKKQKEIELKELESKQEIMKLRNEKLVLDIETKNKELASSTMSIIKKNEFLNDIKKELKKGDGKNIYDVIKIIDKNLNNTNDWEMFQEAFNNADKDFLKKIKTKHNNLTPNDLRLCAYLRLNLSSKEIAPLLNISPRSVEVKRYRLRKKMNLEHESSLTNYILEI
jgi:DNA-binding CsgD family transcriptional regulator